MSTIANDAETCAAYQRHLDAQRVEAEWQHDREQAHRAKDEALAALEDGLRALEEERRAREEAVAREGARRAATSVRRGLNQVRGPVSQGGSNRAALDLPAAFAAYQRHLDAQRVEAEWQHDREQAHRATDAARRPAHDGAAGRTPRSPPRDNHHG